jgi:hypothetical protein
LAVIAGGLYGRPEGNENRHGAALHESDSSIEIKTLCRFLRMRWDCREGGFADKIVYAEHPMLFFT